MILHVTDSFGLVLLTYVVNLAVTSAVVCGVALLLQGVSRRIPLPLRHAILLSGLSVAVASPLLFALIQLTDFSLIGITGGEAESDSIAALTSRDAVSRTNPAHTEVSTPSSSALSIPNEEVSKTTIDRGHDKTSTDALTGRITGVANDMQGRGWHIVTGIGFGLLAAWLIGSCYHLRELAMGVIHIRRVIRSAQPVVEPKILSIARSAADSLHLGALPAIVESSTMEAPISAGIFRAHLILPCQGACGWSDEQWQSLIIHELAHIRRRDLLIGLLQRVGLVAYWWNPLFYRLSATISLVREEICDDLVTKHTPADNGYIALIVELATRVADRRVAGPVLGAAEGNAGELMNRVRRLLDSNRDLSTSLDARTAAAGATIGFGLLLSLAVTGVHVATAEGPKSEHANMQDATTTRADSTKDTLPDSLLSKDELEKVVLVIDTLGKPVVGATVVPWAIRFNRGHHSWTTNGNGASEPPVLTTGADGKVTIRFPRYVNRSSHELSEQLTCRVNHPDFAETSYNDVPVTGAELPKIGTIVLKPGATVEVTAFSGDRPLLMDRVFALWSSRSYEGSKQVKVKADQRLQLPRLPAGEEMMRLAYIPDKGSALFSDVKLQQLSDGNHYELRFEMKPAATVEGKIDASVPRPIKNGRIVAGIIEQSKDHDSLYWQTWALIREDGSFTLDALPRGNLQVIAICDGFMAESGNIPDFISEEERASAHSGRNTPQVFPLVEGENQITVKMTPTAECMIHVRGPDGLPVEGAFCQCSPNVKWWNGGSQIYCAPLVSTLDYLTDPKGVRERGKKDRLFSAETNAAGIAVIKNVPTTEQGFLVTHDQLQMPTNDSNRPEVDVKLVAGRQTEVTVNLQPKEAE
jgi:beta-lactamase regulating signal transducer with metallopeptidase domain